ncbi:GntR family transcriptional regulator [Streptomyces sp. NPDC005438]|uniref:GntR family transcriptional regulator n=1 Tax=Streptomyces sp. NPDC005438 TaxID=3156880 RepID=UPI0033AE03FF
MTEARGEHVHVDAAHPPAEEGRSEDRPPAPRRHSVRAQVLGALRRNLANGKLTPGRVYSAPQLAEHFGVSATPVREAMQQLAVEGAVETVPNRGFRVAQRTPRDLAELGEVRALLAESVVLRLARTLPAERWEELRPLADRASQVAASGDRVAYAEADRAFHGGVLSLTGNRQLGLVADTLHRRAVLAWACSPAPRRSLMLRHADEHHNLLDALVSQDLPLVEVLVREHLTSEGF